MASTSLQAERFVKIIQQQFEILKEERNNVIDAVNHQIIQAESEVHAWIIGGSVNQTTYSEMNNRIQGILTLFLEKTSELLGKQIDKNKADLNQTTTNNLTIPGANLKSNETKTKSFLGTPDTTHNQGHDALHTLTMRFAILEEAVNTIKKTTDQVQDKIENVDKILKDVSTQQVKDHEKVEILTKAKSETEKKIKNKITDLEKRYYDIKSNVDDLIETVTNVDGKLNTLEDENKSVNVSMNEINKQISSVRTCSHDALMSIQDLSKSVESTNQHYDEMSNKMDQLEVSMNLMSSQCTEQFENMSSLTQDKTDSLIGMVCHMLAKRLTPLEKLNETLNKNVNSGDKQLSKKDAIENRVAEMSIKMTEIEHRCNLPRVGFFAQKRQSEMPRFFKSSPYSKVDYNHGGRFDQSTGIFTAPVNGLYLITVMTESTSITNSNKLRCYRIRNGMLDSLLCFSINETVTRFAEIAVGDMIGLEWKTIDENDKMCMSLYFSCYMMQMWT